jgi:hypothetical protein
MVRFRVRIRVRVKIRARVRAPLARACVILSFHVLSRLTPAVTVKNTRQRQAKDKAKQKTKGRHKLKDQRPKT